ncbi:MAG: hypothetical protein ACO1N1_06350 [Dyadobacter fermentans]
MKGKLYLLLVIAMVFVSVAATKAVLPADIIGTWKYMISDVPPEYESGFFTFEKKDDKTVGYVGDTEKEEMKELTVDQEKVAFTIENQAGVFKYSFAQTGDTLTGIVSSQYGDFPIKAVRQAKK